MGKCDYSSLKISISMVYWGAIMHWGEREGIIYWGEGAVNYWTTGDCSPVR